jgi:hypothetical protein
VDAVIAKLRCFVTAAMAEMGYSGQSYPAMYHAISWTHDGGIGHGPLRRSSDTVIEASFVSVVRTRRKYRREIPR